MKIISLKNACFLFSPQTCHKISREPADKCHAQPKDPLSGDRVRTVLARFSTFVPPGVVVPAGESRVDMTSWNNKGDSKQGVKSISFMAPRIKMIVHIKLTLEWNWQNECRRFDLLLRVSIPHWWPVTWPGKPGQGIPPPIYNHILPPVSGSSHRPATHDQGP